MKSAMLPRVGLLLLASQRFHDLGAGTARGPYHERKKLHAEAAVRSLQRGLEVVFPGPVYGQEDLKRAVGLFRQREVDFVMAEYLSWSEDAQWVRFLRDVGDFPILFTHTVRADPGFRDTEDEDDFIEFLCAGGLVGTLEASGSLRRIAGRRVKAAVGDAESVAREAFLFGRAAASAAALRRSQLGLLGHFNEVMWSTYVDPYGIFSKLGPQMRFISYADFSLDIKEVSDAEASRYVRELQERHEVLPDVKAPLFLESARASLAMARVAQRLGLSILVLNDIDHALFRAIGLRPGFYPQWFHDNGSVLVPEGDVGSGVAAFLLAGFSGKHVNYIEPFYIDAAQGCFVGGHAGPNDHTDPAAAGRVKIARDVRFAKTNFRYAGAPFAWHRFAPGPKTMAQFSELNGRYKLVCTMVDALDGPHFITSYSHGVFRPRIPVNDLFRRIVEIGGTQHFAIVDGDCTRELETFSSLADVDFYKVE